MVEGSTEDFQVPEESPSAEVCAVVDNLPENGTLQCDVQVLVTTVLGTACKSINYILSSLITTYRVLARTNSTA